MLPTIRPSHEREQNSDLHESRLHSGHGPQRHTLLDLVLGGHPRFVGLGELSAFVDSRRGHLDHLDTQLCSCRQTLKDCKFWGPLGTELRRLAPKSPHDQYEMVLSAFDEHFGQDRVLVDSSKTVETVLTWADLVGKDNVRMLFLVRDVRGWVTSMIDLSKRTGEHRVGDLLANLPTSCSPRSVVSSACSRIPECHRSESRAVTWFSATG